MATFRSLLKLCNLQNIHVQAKPSNKMHCPVLLGHSPSLLTRTFLTHSLCPWNVFTQKLQCTESLTVSLKGWDPKISCLTPCKPGSSSLNRMTYIHSQAKGTGQQIY